MYEVIEIVPDWKRRERNKAVLDWFAGIVLFVLGMIAGVYVGVSL